MDILRETCTKPVSNPTFIETARLIFVDDEFGFNESRDKREKIDRRSELTHFRSKLSSSSSVFARNEITFHFCLFFCDNNIFYFLLSPLNDKTYQPKQFLEVCYISWYSFLLYNNTNCKKVFCALVALLLLIWNLECILNFCFIFILFYFIYYYYRLGAQCGFKCTYKNDSKWKSNELFIGGD